MAAVKDVSTIKDKVSRPDAGTKVVNLALQGGGAHGAFAWGVLDYLLEDGRLAFEGVSATSAGAMNAVACANGMLKGGREGARAALHEFWKAVSDASSMSPMKPGIYSQMTGSHGLDDSPFYQYFGFLSRIFSPYQLNPFNLNPLKQILEKHIDFERLRTEKGALSLHICATNVETGKIRIFTNRELTPDAVLASACLPMMFQSVEIGGEYFWDGGYIGNPAIFPLIYESESRDVVIVHINPIVRKGCPTTAADIINRLNEISFNSSLMREMRAVTFVSQLIESGKVKEGEMKQMLIHSVRADEFMSELGVSSKMNSDWKFLVFLRDAGRKSAAEWLDSHFPKIGHESTVDIHKEFF
jgi:NTE family protein